MNTPLAVYVCPTKDIECGSVPANWCAECPKNQTQVWVPATTRAPVVGAETILSGISTCDILPVAEREKLVRWLRKQYNLPE